MLKGKLSIALCTSVLIWGLVPNWGKLEPLEGVFAQDASPKATFPLPESVPDGTTVKIETSDSMQEIAESVQGGFIERYKNSAATVELQETDVAIKNLIDGKIDVAAIGRPLTKAEKDQGLIPVPVSRHKIAIIIGADNPLDANTVSLDIEKFAKMFRGEIKDWSEVEGPAGPVRFIDRPDNSDTRQAFPTYPVFEQAPFQTGATAEKVAEDTTDAVIEKLGKDGISYAIYDQVKGNPKVKILQMSKVLPDDERYPFSQPLYFVYKGPEASPGVQALLGYTTDAATQEAIEKARASQYATATPEASPTETPVASPTESPVAQAPVEQETRGGFPWWILLLPLLLLPLLFLRKGESSTEEAVVAPPPPPPAPLPPNRIILTPHNCRDAYAYWEVPEERKAELRRQGGENLKLRLYDVTDIDIDRQEPHSTQEFNCSETEPDLHVPIARDGRDYIAELGYVTDTGNWLSLVRSLPVRVPNCPTEAPLPVISAPTLVEDIPASRIILTPRSCRDVYAYWEVPEARKAQLKAQGGENLVLRVYDVTGIDIDQDTPHSVRHYDVLDSVTDYHVPIDQDDRDYIGEIGYLTADNRFLSLARSVHIRVPACPPEIIDAEEDTAISSFIDEDLFIPTVTSLSTDDDEMMSLFEDEDLFSPTVTPIGETSNYINLVSRSADEAYVSWRVSEGSKANLRQQGGETLILRLYDLTDLNEDGRPDSMWDHECTEFDNDRIIPLYQGDRNYMVELGYRTAEGRWLPLIQSDAVYIPPKDSDNQ